MSELGTDKLSVEQRLAMCEAALGAAREIADARVAVARDIVRELCRTANWVTCRSGSEKSQAWYAAQRRAREFLSAAAPLGTEPAT
jgi:hypothetical protein